MRILVFLPTYNEKANIGKLIDKLNRLNFEKELLIVDDNSPDGTIEIIKEKMKQFDNIKLIIRTGQKGRGLAGIAGLKYFVNSEYEILVEMDADLSHDPKYIPKFLKYFPKYDVVIGSRFIHQGQEKGRNKLRQIISFLANLFIKIILGTKIKDCTSGFRAFKKTVLEKLNFDQFISVNPEIVEELLYGCVLTKSKIIEVPIIYYERVEGSSKLNIKKILFVFLAVIKIRLRSKKILK